MPTRFSFIIVARSREECQPALEAVSRLEWPVDQIERLVAIGSNPSEQRNQAAVQARGEYLVFLDNDSRLHPKALHYFEDALSYEADIGAVGGPSVYDGDGSAFKTALHAVFSSVFGLGPFRARYAPIGRVRATTERDLILCNLLVRRTLFLSEGGFRAELYPNEENEFLNRVGSHARLYYHPLAICYREPRGDFVSFAKQLLGYGVGRAKHLLRYRHVWENIFFVPMIFAFYVLGLGFASAWICFLPLALYFVFAVAAAALSAIGRRKPWLLFALPLLFFCCHFFYGIGFAYGLVSALRSARPPVGSVDVCRIE